MAGEIRFCFLQFVFKFDFAFLETCGAGVLVREKATYRTYGAYRYGIDLRKGFPFSSRTRVGCVIFRLRQGPARPGVVARVRACHGNANLGKEKIPSMTLHESWIPYLTPGKFLFLT